MDSIVNIFASNVDDTATSIAVTTGLSYPAGLLCMIICCVLVYKLTKKVIHIILTITVFAIILVFLAQFGLF